MTNQNQTSLLKQLAEFATPLISDNMERLQGAVGLKPFNNQPRFSGRAFTVKTRPGDNLYVHLALDLAEPGDVIVVDAEGHDSNAIVGEIMKSYAESRGIVGFVIDGAIRDVESFAAGDFKCFAKSVCHRGPYKSGPGTIRCAINIGGMVVNHGDYIIGDADGLISIQPKEAEALLAKVRSSFAMEKKLLSDIQDGCFDRAWLKPLITQNGGQPSVKNSA